MEKIKLTKEEFDELIEWAESEMFEWQKFKFILKQKYPKYASNTSKPQEDTK